MEIYQLHWPFGIVNSKYWDGLADCVEKGLVKVNLSLLEPSSMHWSRVATLRWYLAPRSCGVRAEGVIAGFSRRVA